MEKRTRFPWAQAAKAKAQAKWVLPVPLLPITRTFSRDVLPPGQFPHQLLVDGGQGGEVEGIQGLHHGEAGLLDSPFRRFAFPIQQLAFSQA